MLHEPPQTGVGGGESKVLTQQLSWRKHLRSGTCAAASSGTACDECSLWQPLLHAQVPVSHSGVPLCQCRAVGGEHSPP